MSLYSPFLFPPYDPEILVLRPLLIAPMVSPIAEGDGGINISAACDDPDGILCAINAYGDMKEGDKHVIYWDTKPVLTREVEADEINQRLFFYLPAVIAEPGWVEECYYQLTRFGETTPDDPAVPLRLLVKLNRPGGRDKSPHLPDGHSELHPVQLPPEVVQQGIDAEWAAKGVPVTVPFYPDMALRDTVLVRWGTTVLPPHTVTQDEVDGKTPIVIVADQAAILAGGDSDALVLRYDARDEIWNWAARHSQSTQVRVEAGAWHLDPPIIKESINGIIDLKELNQKDVTVQVVVLSDEFDLGDTITLSWIGTPLGGTSLIHSESKTVVNNSSVMEFKVPYAQIRAIAEGDGVASYVLTKINGDPPLSSKNITARVSGDISMPPAPTIRELLGDTLESDEPYATVDVRYPLIADGDLINLWWKGKRSNGNPYVHEDQHIVTANEAEEGIITFYVNSEHISVLDKGSLTLSYVVSNDKVALFGVIESERLLVKVEKVRATLPAPKVEEADPPGDVLDPSKVYDIVHVLIDQAETVKDDIVAYYWRSPNPFGSTGDSIPITTVIEGDPLRFRIPVEFVTANIGQYVKVHYSVLRASNNQYEHSASLSLLIGELIGDLPPPDVIQAVDGILDPMKGLTGVDVKASYLSMKPDKDMIRLKWLGSPGPGTSDDLELPGHSSGTVQFHLPATVIGANIERRVTVEFDVTRYTLTTPSCPLDLYVSGFSDPENQLPRPEVPQATDDVLDLMTFSGDAKVLVGKWPYIAVKQFAWLEMVGETTSGVAYTIKIIEGKEITSTELNNGLNEPLLRSELMKLGHSTAATVICKVAFNGGSQESSAYVFPPLPLTIRTRYDYLTPEITRVADSRTEIEEGGKTRDDEVTVTGTATRGETIELFDGGSASMGTARVEADSNWSRKIGTLTEKLYSITAKALYDADPVSSLARTFTVKFAQTPEILVVSDSRGPVAPGATTYDNSVLVEGSATPNLQVQLLGSDESAITLDVDESGRWSRRLNNLKVKTYSLTAEALYDVDPPVSPPRTFVVAQAVTPTISRVSDIRGEVEMNGTTYYRTVTLSGKASPNEKITLLDVTTTIDTVDVKPSGDWAYVFNNLTLKAYRLTARAEYGANPVSTPVRVFTVAAHVSPTIKTVRDSIGLVEQNGTTYDRTVTVSGEATPKEQIQLYNKSTPVGSPVTVQANKTWTLPVTGLAVTSHSITAKALYEVTPIESSASTFTVAVHVGPTLDSVHDGISEVVQNGQTKSTAVTLRGTVTPNHQVQIYDNTTPKHTVTAQGNTWTTTLQVGLGGHSVKARAISTGQETGVRNFTVISPIPPLNFNTSPVTLSGRIYLIPGNPEVLPAFGSGTSVQHQASGGQPGGYTYTSLNPNAAVVDGSGRVTVRGNGSTIIKVSDRANQSKSYTVYVTGVIHCAGLSQGNWTTIRNNAAANGYRLPTLGELREIYALYGNRWPMGNYYYWSADAASSWPIARYYMKNLVNGTEAHVQHYGSALGVGIR
ncbi:Ig-like domain-containing protein [Pseudomonas baetica]|uniref:Ig-like domain-containing protein n=1 Tax=Pseudomonas baetica TaxID=674054 RepID=UPI001C8BABF4|nr:Ig-like domain-containing protein [Pseudomonas baetica]MBX9410476.1 Ig-like domain-containing protein [Pseudomonas baetica]